MSGNSLAPEAPEQANPDLGILAQEDVSFEPIDELAEIAATGIRRGDTPRQVKAEGAARQHVGALRASRDAVGDTLDAFKAILAAVGSDADLSPEGRAKKLRAKGLELLARVEAEGEDNIERAEAAAVELRESLAAPEPDQDRAADMIALGEVRSHLLSNPDVRLHLESVLFEALDRSDGVTLRAILDAPTVFGELRVDPKLAATIRERWAEKNSPAAQQGLRAIEESIAELRDFRKSVRKLVMSRCGFRTNDSMVIH